MKKTLLYIILIIFVSFGFIRTAFASEKYIEGYFTYTIEDDGVHIVSYNGDEGEVSIPWVIGNLEVKSIKADAFANSETTKVIIPENNINIEGGNSLENVSTYTYSLVEDKQPGSIDDKEDSQDEQQGTSDTPGTSIEYIKAGQIDQEASANSLIYTGSTQTLISSASSSTGTIYYKLGNDGRYSKDLPKATNAGDYTIYYYSKGDSTHYDSDVYSVDVTINKAALNISTSNQTYTYENSTSFGVGIRATTKNNKNASVLYKVGGGQYSSDVPKFSKAGEYIVYYLASADNHNDASGSYTVTIKRIKGVVDKAPIGKSNLTYTGAELALIDAGSSSTGTMYYKVGSGSYSKDLPKTKQAGTYTVYYKSVGDDNHLDTAETSIVVKVNNAKINVVAGNQNYTYNGKKQGSQINVTTVNNQQATITYRIDATNNYSENVAQISDVGTKTIYYKVSAPNHDDATGSYKITISKANFKIECDSEQTYNYDGNKHGKAVIAKTVDGNIAQVKYRNILGFYFLNDAPTYTDVGDYTVHYRVEDSNHNLYEGSYKIKIIQSDGIIKVHPNAKTLTYNGLAQELVTKGVSASGEMMYSLSEKGTYSTSVPVASNAGDYVIYYYGKASNNYKQSETYKLNVTINKANIDSYISPSSIDNLSYTGQTLELINMGVSNKGTFKYKLESEKDFSTNIPTSKEIGKYTINYYVDGGNNYYDTKINSITINVDKAKIDVKAADQTYIYNGQQQGKPISAYTVDNSKVTIKYGKTKGSYTLDEPLTFKEIGTYTIYYKVSATNHYDNEGSFEINILKNDGSFKTLPIGKDLVYNGKQQELIHAGSSSTGTIYYKIGSQGTYSTDIPKATNAGNYIVYFYVKGDNQHEDSLEGHIDVTINRLSVGLPPRGVVSLIYNGKVQTNGYLLIEGITMTGESSGTKVGEYIAKYTPDENHCWNDNTFTQKTCKLVIVENDENLISDAVTIEMNDDDSFEEDSVNLLEENSFNKLDTIKTIIIITSLLAIGYLVYKLVIRARRK